MMTRNSSRSSARWIASRLAPIIWTLNSFRVPSSHSLQAQFRAVCPPRVGRMASTGVPIERSLARILRTASGVIGSM